MVVRFSRKYTRVISLFLLLILAIAIYVAGRFSYAVFSSALPQRKTSSSSRQLPVIDTHVSQGQDGNLMVALSMNLRSILGYLNGYTGDRSEATSNPVPLDVNIVMHNESLCESLPQLRWLFYVHSAPGNRARRDVIRTTWGDPDVHAPHTTQLVFMLGKTSDRNVQV